MTQSDVILMLVLFVFAYLLGSIPSGLVVGKVGYGVNLFEHGSNNMGATNAFRTLGWKAGALVFAGDVLKGVVAALVSGLLLADAPWVQAMAAIIAVVGHSWSVFAGFKGGRGVATAFGAALVIYPLAWLVGAVISFTIVGVLRYVSLGSLLGTLAAVATGIILYSNGSWLSPWGLAFMIPTAALIVWQHRPNLYRLATGTELRLAAWPTYFAGRKDQGAGKGTGQ